MAHELAVTLDGRSAMAYVGDKPWHGLGQELTVGQPIDVWAREAGMDFFVQAGEIQYEMPGGRGSFPSKKVLYRSDTGMPLSVVGSKYKVVQPIEILEFFRDLTANNGWELETAGVLFNGAKYWALARTGQEVRIAGQDLLKDYVMLATACDGTLKTVAKRTSVRVVCNNTLSIATSDSSPSVKVSHSSTFSAEKVHAEMGLTDSWHDFADKAAELAQRKVSNQEAVAFVTKLFGDINKPLDQQPAIQTIGKVLQLFDGGGRGAELASAKGTAWGLVNSVTEYNLYNKGKNQSRRLDNAWFLGGERQGVEAFDLALQLLAA